MATNRGMIAVTVAAGSVFEASAWIAAGSFIGGSQGSIDRMLVRPVVGSAVWSDDPRVNATVLNASIGILMTAADARPVAIPGLPQNFKLKALGTTVLTCLFYEGGTIDF